MVKIKKSPISLKYFNRIIFNLPVMLAILFFAPLPTAWTDSDASNPTLTLSRSSSGTESGPFEVQFEFSTGVSGFEESEIEVTHGVVETGSFTKVDDSTYTVVISPEIGETSTTITVPEGAAYDQEMTDIPSARSLAPSPLVVPTSGSWSTTMTAGYNPSEMSYFTGFIDTDSGYSDSDIGALEHQKFRYNGKNYTILGVGYMRLLHEVDLMLDRSLEDPSPDPDEIHVSHKLANPPHIELLFNNGEGAEWGPFDVNLAWAWSLSPPHWDYFMRASLGIRSSLSSGDQVTVTLRQTEAPSVKVTTRESLYIHGPFTVDFEFGEDVTGFEASDIALVNASVVENSFTKVNARFYTVRVSPTVSGEVTVSVPSNVAHSSTDSSRGNRASNSFRVDADLSTPTVTIAFDETQPMSMTVVPLKITFSKPMMGFSTEDIVVTGGRAYTPPRNGAHYNVAIYLNEGVQEATVSVPANAAQDLAGRGNAASEDFHIVILHPLTSSFHNVPAEHDGSTHFTFELHFSENVPGLSYRTLRDSAFQVTGGQVKEAKRMVRGNNQRWRITVKPNSAGDVAITLPQTTDCSAVGAICVVTDDYSKKLAFSSTLTVTGSPPAEVPPDTLLTGSFHDMPAEHNGSKFTFELHFSENVSGLSYRTLRDSAFQVTGGVVKRAKRMVRGNNQKWRITVKPNSSASDVAITLPQTTDCSATGAICVLSDRKFSQTLSATVAGP